MIEELLYKHLQSHSKELEPYLATFADKPAIFSQEAPKDTDKGWKANAPQYGRVVFAIDTNDDPEREISGILSVDISCTKDQTPPEYIEPIIKDLIDGYFFTTEGQTIAAHWSASNYFTEPPNQVNGVTITFELLAFPHQQTLEPDPIQLLNKWTREELTKAIGTNIHVIGYDTMAEEVWKPTDQYPAIYWRLMSIGPCGWIPDTYHCSWHTASMQGHVFVPDSSLMAAISRCIGNILTLKKRLIFEDNSPLMVDRNIRITNGTNPMRQGQVTIDGTYGILNIQPEAPVMNHISVKGGA